MFDNATESWSKVIFRPVGNGDSGKILRMRETATDAWNAAGLLGTGITGETKALSELVVMYDSIGGDNSF